MKPVQTFNQVSEQGIRKKINHIRSTKTWTLSNYYFQDFEDRGLYSLEAEKSIVFYYQDAHLKRVFFYSADPDEVKLLLNCIEGQCVVDYISRSGEEPAGSILRKCGYHRIACYVKVVNTCIQEQMKKPQIAKLRRFCSHEEVDFADRKDFDFIHASMNKVFDVYTDHLPSPEVLRQYIDNRQVLVNRNDDKAVGYIVFQNAGIWSHFNYFYGSPADNPACSISLLFAYYDLLREIGISCVYGWVREENSEMLSIHNRFDYIQSEVKDFIYFRGE